MTLEWAACALVMAAASLVLGLAGFGNALVAMAFLPYFMPPATAIAVLTIYTIVNALTVNLPAVTSVQVLVDGKEVDTLAGHIDLRQPLAKNLSWIQ